MTGRIGLDRLSLNQATVKHLGLPEAVALCARHEIPAIGLWRDRVAETGLAAAAAAVRAAGLRVSSLCRGGFFTSGDMDRALAGNRSALAEAAELGTDTLVLVCGGLPPGQRDLGLARRMVADAIGELVPEAQRLGVRLGIEALHPMFCADRCVISSLGEAVDLALRFPADAVGVVVDTYHVWWDARLADEIARARGRIVSFQVCDWVLPLPADPLLGRGHLGDGVIDFGPVTAAVAAAGYHGFVEVEIFNAGVWGAPPDQTAATVRERFAAVFGRPLEALLGGGVGEAVEILVQDLAEHGFGGGGAGEQGHRGAELERVDLAEDLLGGAAGQAGEDGGAFGQPRAENRVGQVGPGLGQRADRVQPGRRAVAQAGDLREDEPHPVAGLAAGPQLGGGAVVGAAGVLGGHEPLQIVGVVGRPAR